MRGASLTEDPDYIATYSRQLTEATPESVRRAAQAVYGRPGHRLIVRPVPLTRAVAGGYDLSKGPPAKGPPDIITFPKVERTRLANGLEIVLVPRPATARASMLMRFDSGIASTRAPVGQMAVQMLVDGVGPTQRRAESLGGRIGAIASDDVTDVTMSVDTKDLAAGLDLLDEVVARPDLTDDRLSIIRKARRDLVKQELSGAPSYQRILRNAVFGSTHSYGRNADPAADIPAIDAVGLADVKAWVQQHIRPDRARLYIAGNTDMATLRASNRTLKRYVSVPNFGLWPRR